MKRSKSSQQWLKRQAKDPFVKRRQAEGARSRAVYKLEEIQHKKRLIKPGMVVVDLGAAPGGWSQCASQWVGNSGRVIAVDCLAMPAIVDVEFIQGDFTEDRTLHALLTKLNISVNGDYATEPFYCPAVDVVLSDMAPNFSGVVSVDQPRSLHLAELAWDFSTRLLHPGGHFMVKVFQGRGVEDFMRTLKSHFAKVSMLKPMASRADSREMYIVATDFRKTVAS